MSIDWLRDLIICVFGLVAIGVSVFIAVLLFSLYRRVSPILDSIKAISGTIQAITSGTEGMIKPLVQAVALAQGIRQGIEVVNKLFKKKEGGKDG